MAQSSESIEHLLEDVSYLIYEMDALESVINEVPLYENPANSESIFDLIAMIDFAQTHYYKPLLEQLFTQVKVDVSIKPIKQLYKESEQEVEEIEELLPRLISNRKKISDWLSKIPMDSFFRTGKINAEHVSMQSLLADMLQFERKQLRLVADRVIAMDSTTSEKPQ